MNTKVLNGLAALGGVVAAAAIGATVMIATGTYNVAATEPHARPVEWALRSTMERSVREQAEAVAVPAGVDVRDPALAARAIGHYSVACAGCHGAPGSERAPWMVLYPEPENLTRAEVVDRWSDGELYWIVKNGIKDTGMIALGPTHKEEDLWAVTAFVRQLPTMPKSDYEALVAKYQAEHAGHAHR
ncbi:MAG: cytochrome c [Myxococcales bacterium]|nr:cytochrome c [Myxococcales bacterium]